MVDQDPERPSTPLRILPGKPCKADDREPRTCASLRADHSLRERCLSPDATWGGVGRTLAVGSLPGPFVDGETEGREEKALLALPANKPSGTRQMQQALLGRVMQPHPRNHPPFMGSHGGTSRERSAAMSSLTHKSWHSGQDGCLTQPTATGGCSFEHPYCPSQ